MKPSIRCVLTAAPWMLAVLASAPALAGFKEGMDALAVKDYARARAEFEAETSEPKAIYQLSRMASQGLGESRDETRAANLLRRAADLGHTEAKLDLAFVLANGRGAPKDVAKAVALLEELAAAGHSEGQVNLGRALRYGLWGQAKDEARASTLFEKAMAAGDDDGRSYFALGLMDGLGVPRDEQRGAALLKQGAERGHLPSQLEYARLLTFGIAVPKDETAGTEWYRKAAERGNMAGQYGVGMAYLRGRGVARDESAAVRWIDAAARQGWGWAQVQMGDLFRLGTGVPKLRTEAFSWYSIAAKGSASAAERANSLRAEMSRDMTAAEIATAVRRADAFRLQPGLRPRQEAMPPLARGDKINLGQAAITVPAPSGYANGWQLAEFLYQAYPNDPDLRPLLMVLSNQEDMDRMKLGLPSPSRHVEIGRHAPDDGMVISPKLYLDMKAQLRQQVDENVRNGRYKVEAVVRDDDRSFAVIRSSTTDPQRVDGMAVLLVRDRALAVSYTGFRQEHRAELEALLKSSTDEILSANNRGFFGL